ncbi:hypothetical protein ACN28C_32970 [Plantactinospora sp. WMMC1484]|uniref:hypothetical protein n=1 Tax=Plantactinospora sp. WMMC1484 TaxID=3404122 RepID=UPI003BF5F2F5
MMGVHRWRGPDQQRELIGELRAAGLAPTAQRRLVLDALHGHDHPASAIAIYQRLRADGRTVG